MSVRRFKLERAAFVVLTLIIANPACHLRQKTDAPVTPSAPSGPSSGLPDSTYSFTASTTDPNGDSLSYLFDWGDGLNSHWSYLFASGATVTMSHAWSAAGTYSVTVKVHNTKQVTSDPSPAHSVKIGTTSVQ